MSAHHHSTRHLGRAIAAAALFALVPSTALAAPPTRASGPLTDLSPAVNPTDGASARVHAVASASGTTVTLHVTGLDPAAAGTTLGAHVHVGPCVAGDGAAAGPHFNIDRYDGVVPPEVSPRTEVWLDITGNRNGVGHAVAHVPFHIPPGAAASVVIHALPTDDAGGAGARLACIGIAL